MGRTKITLGFILGLGMGTGISVVAAPGDSVVVAGGTAVEIPGASAAAHADQAISDGCWSGNRANLMVLTIRRFTRADDTTGFKCQAKGLKAYTPGTEPIGSKIVSRVE